MTSLSNAIQNTFSKGTLLSMLVVISRNSPPGALGPAHTQTSYYRASQLVS